MSRMKLLRIVVGLIVIAGALFIIIGEQLSGASGNAFVNARITTLRAPIAGSLQLTDRPLGARVGVNDPIGTISGRRVDDVRLADLINERAVHQANVDRLAVTIQSLASAIDKLRTRAAVYLEERTQQLRAQVDAAASLSAAAAARLRHANTRLERSTRLSERGIQAAESLDEARSLAEVSELELKNAQQQGAVSSIGLAAAERGIFLGDGYNDAPYSEQRISELEVQKAELQAQLDAQTASLRSIDTRIASERGRVNRLSSATLESNVNGLIWDYLAASNETVQNGQDLLRLVDCGTVIVSLSVSESVYNTITHGDRVSFRLDGSSRLLDGTVTRLAGSGTATIYENLAIKPSQRHLQRFDVTLDVPALREDQSLSCLIGRTGRVFFDSRPLDWIRRLWA